MLHPSYGKKKNNKTHRLYVAASVILFVQLLITLFIFVVLTLRGNDSLNAITYGLVVCSAIIASTAPIALKAYRESHDLSVPMKRFMTLQVIASLAIIIGVPAIIGDSFVVFIGYGVPAFSAVTLIVVAAAIANVARWVSPLYK